MAVSRDYLPNLDLLRFLAALYVVSTHYGFIGPEWGMTGYQTPSGWISEFFRLGYIGVPVFFALSGFLIAHVSQNTDAIRFGVNRILRLMPGFWASMTLSFVVLVVLGTPNDVSFSVWVANLFLVPQAFGQPFVDGVYWTLVYEFVFYGWAAVFIFFGIFHRYILWIGAAWLAISTANLFVLENGLLDRLFVTKFAGSFIVGMAFWHIYKNGLSIFAAALIAAATAHLSFGLELVSAQSFLPNPPMPLTLLQAAALSGFIVAAVGVGIFGPQIKNNTDVLVTLGAISYPLYLIHQEIGYAVFRHLDVLNQPVLIALGMTLAMIIVAYALHETCERPLRKFLQKKLMPLADFVADRIQAIKSRGMNLKTAES